MLQEVPEWFGAAAFGALVAALGYVGRIAVEAWNRWREEMDRRRARLVELQSLLRAARVSFVTQNEHARCLLAMIGGSNPGVVGADGFEANFARAYKDLTEEERELHALIRSITVFSLHSTNSALSEWLRADTYFKAQHHAGGVLAELAGKLAELEAHLIIWHAKYKATILPDRPDRALVYLADEHKHGTRFPEGIDGIVDRAVKEF